MKMVKKKVAELDGGWLSYIVAQCEGFKVKVRASSAIRFPHSIPLQRDNKTGRYHNCLPYEWKWEHAGPIIEREKIVIVPPWPNDTEWYAYIDPYFETIHGAHDSKGIGPTPLIAAMRAYVASRMGEEVEVPDVP